MRISIAFIYQFIDAAYSQCGLIHTIDCIKYGSSLCDVMDIKKHFLCGLAFNLVLKHCPLLCPSLK